MQIKNIEFKCVVVDVVFYHFELTKYQYESAEELTM